jgi:hypothetical protein
MKSDEKQKHLWNCDMSRGDTQCPYVTPNGGGYLNCTWRVGHPADLPHEICHDQTTPPPEREWFSSAESFWRNVNTGEEGISDTQIKVPEGMLKAALKASEYISYEREKKIMQWYPQSVVPMLEEALRWQKENPPVPTAEQWSALLSEPELWGGTAIVYGIRCAVAWVRRMYDEPEPEVPEEVTEIIASFIEPQGKAVQAAILEAYQRGKKAGSKA